MNLCTLCVLYDKKKHVCTHPHLASFLGKQIPSGIKLYSCSYFVMSDKTGDVVIRLSDGKKVMYDYTKIKFHPKTILL